MNDGHTVVWWTFRDIWQTITFNVILTITNATSKNLPSTGTKWLPIMTYIHTPLVISVNYIEKKTKLIKNMVNKFSCTIFRLSKSLCPSKVSLNKLVILLTVAKWYTWSHLCPIKITMSCFCCFFVLLLFCIVLIFCWSVYFGFIFVFVISAAEYRNVLHLVYFTGYTCKI